MPATVDAGDSSSLSTSALTAIMANTVACGLARSGPTGAVIRFAYETPGMLSGRKRNERGSARRGDQAGGEGRESHRRQQLYTKSVRAAENCDRPWS